MKKKVILQMIIIFIISSTLFTILGCKSKNSSSNSGNNNSSYSSSNNNSYEMTHEMYCLLYMKISNVEVTHKRNYTYCTGTITNTGEYSIKYVKVKAALKDYSGKVIDTDWTYAVDSTWLEPGESKTFEMMIKDEYGDIKKADVTVITD